MASIVVSLPVMTAPAAGAEAVDVMARLVDAGAPPAPAVTSEVAAAGSVVGAESPRSDHASAGIDPGAGINCVDIGP